MAPECAFFSVFFSYNFLTYLVRRFRRFCRFIHTFIAFTLFSFFLHAVFPLLLLDKHTSQQHYFSPF